MYCKECGSPLREGDTVCKVCGTTIDKIIENDKYNNKSEVEITESTNSPGQESEKIQSDKRNPEFEWNVYDFPQPKKTEKIDFNWGIDDDREKASPIEKELFKEMKDLQDHDSNIDKFFTFNKKNEEFQELLDKEYERIKKNESIQDTESIIHRMENVQRRRDEEAEEEIIVLEEEIPLNDEKEEETIVIPDVILENDAGDNDDNSDSNSLTEAEDLKEEDLENNEKESLEDNLLWFESDDEDKDIKKDEYRKKGNLKKIVLVIVILVLLAEVIALGIKYFAPESQAAEEVTNIQVAISRTFNGWKDNVIDFFGEFGDGGELTSGDSTEEDKDNVQDDEEDEIDEPLDPAPNADKNVLIESQLFNNKNIETVRANDNLKYQEDMDYGILDINESHPIQNNIWMTNESGETLYYDKEIVATLISFNSQWVEYVKGEDNQILDLLKKDSKAYNNVTTFSKVGKVTQNFITFEIGELRQGDNGFYVWTHEEIKETEGSKVNNKEYYWIYHLEPIESDIKIVNYYKYSLE